jgi:curved DNA-binding protein
MAESLYDHLGVAKTATAEEIRKAYRKLARKHHPDVNPGDAAAEAAFKKISVAYDVLSDEKKKKAYDEFGDASLQSGFDPGKAREYARWQDAHRRRASQFGDEQGPVEFDLGELFGRRAQRGPARGNDLHASVDIELRQAMAGTEMTADLPGHGSVRIRIPKGADTGDTLRVPGKGAAGRNGGPPGDLVIETVVRPHPLVRREGLDLHLTLPVTLAEAYGGASIEVPTFDGPVTLKIPPAHAAAREAAPARQGCRPQGRARRHDRRARRPDAGPSRRRTRRCGARSRQALHDAGSGGPCAMTRYTYQHLLELVEGDRELLVHLVDEGLIERRDDLVSVDVDAVLLARTLWRDLDVEWPGIEIIVKLTAQLAAARRRIQELEAALAK